MESRHTRRTLLKRGGSAALATAIGHQAHTGAAQSGIDSGGIGLQRPDWEAIAGEGTAVGDLVEYANPDMDDFTVLALFGGEMVSHLEFGYEEADAGGLPEDDVRAQIIGAMPSDAELTDVFSITAVNRERIQYRAERYVSAQLGQEASGLPTILVLWQMVDVGFGTPNGIQTVVPRVTLTLPGPHTLEFRETGNPGGIGLSREEWIANYGDPEPTQGGDLFANAVLPDLQLLVQFAPGDRASLVDTVSAGMMPIVTHGEGQALVNSLLPAESILRDVFRMPSTPEGLAALVVEIWENPALMDESNESGFALAFYEQAIDTNPVTVSRVAVALPVLSDISTATPES